MWYTVRNHLRSLINHTYPPSIPDHGSPLVFQRFPEKSTSYQEYRFSFLNDDHTFQKRINWNFDELGKLWAYNLNYMDYLLQPGMSGVEGKTMISEFIDGFDRNRVGLEPYPISLRGINWIKFLSLHDIADETIDANLKAQYRILTDNLEYHILGNHLLENGCSLLFGAFYFQDHRLWSMAKTILTEELDEQVLSDGGHYERSVMYHTILLERLLDCSNLMSRNQRFEDQQKLEHTIRERSARMLGWLRQMRWKDGQVPEVNDHVTEMMPSLSGVIDYSERLGINPATVALGESGYRKVETEHYEMVMDVGPIGPDYVPGHAHSDIFSFIIRTQDNDIITDMATSTYENGKRRTRERSTEAHNTVVVEGREQNEVWSAFRVGRRAEVEILKEQQGMIRARHTGYRHLGIIHERSFHYGGDRCKIEDKLTGRREKIVGEFFVHFAPDVSVSQSGNAIYAENIRILFEGHHSIKLQPYQKAVGYNRHKKTTRAVITFSDKLTTTVLIES